MYKSSFSRKMEPIESLYTDGFGLIIFQNYDCVKAIHISRNQSSNIGF